jgi:uncharacterized protein YndB with AHSA1/START domain
MPSTIKLHRVFKTTPERLYKAFLTPDALVKFMAPHGFTAKVHSMDPKVGGSYKMSFTNFGTGSSHSFGGEYLELVPNQRIVHTDRFDAGLPGTMKVTIDIRKVIGGAELNIVQEGVPDEIPAEMCYLGWGETLDLLKLLVEPEIPDQG